MQPAEPRPGAPPLALPARRSHGPRGARVAARGRPLCEAPPRGCARDLCAVPIRSGHGSAHSSATGPATRSTGSSALAVLNPTSGVVQVNLGLARLWAARGDPLEAWRRALERAPDTPYAVTAGDLLHPQVRPRAADLRPGRDGAGRRLPVSLGWPARSAQTAAEPPASATACSTASRCSGSAGPLAEREYAEAARAAPDHPGGTDRRGPRAVHEGRSGAGVLSVARPPHPPVSEGGPPSDSTSACSLPWTRLGSTRRRSSPRLAHDGRARFAARHGKLKRFMVSRRTRPRTQSTGDLSRSAHAPVPVSSKTVAATERLPS